MFGYALVLPSPADFKDAKFPRRGNFAPFSPSLVSLLRQVLRKAFFLRAGMVFATGTVADEREEKRSEGRPAGAAKRLFESLPEQRNTLPARDKKAFQPAGLGRVS